MGRKYLLRAEELAALILEELRKTYHCSGAMQVTVGPRREIHPVTGAYWAPIRVNPGTSGVEICQRELWRVCERLGRQYELAP
jgi:hypothetical protein